MGELFDFKVCEAFARNCEPTIFMILRTAPVATASKQLFAAWPCAVPENHEGEGRLTGLDVRVGYRRVWGGDGEVGYGTEREIDSSDREVLSALFCSFCSVLFLLFALRSPHGHHQVRGEGAAGPPPGPRHEPAGPQTGHHMSPHVTTCYHMSPQLFSKFDI